jgi:hypothetical protein
VPGTAREPLAGSVCDDNLTKPDIATFIAAGMIARAQRTTITQDKVLADLEAVKQDAMSKATDKAGKHHNGESCGSAQGARATRPAPGNVERPDSVHRRGEQRRRHSSEDCRQEHPEQQYWLTAERLLRRVAAGLLGRVRYR